MEDDNSLELSLGLTCGRSSSTATKGKHVNVSEPKTEETDKGTKLIHDFNNFLHGRTQKQDSTTNENFFNNLSKPTDNSKLNNGGFWASNDNLSTQVEEEKRPEVGNKRQGLFEEINPRKKHNSINDKTKTSHISITTDEGSTGDNEDVADSEVDSSKSKEFEHGNVSYSVQFPPQSVNMSYIKESKTMPPVINANLPVMFGYSPVQLPVLDKDNTGRGLVSQPQQFQVSYFGRGAPNLDVQNDAAKKSQGSCFLP